MTNQSEKLSLSDALEIFDPHLDEICESLAENITDQLEALPPVPEGNNETEKWLWAGVRELEVEAITATPLRVIRRIQSRKYYTSVEHQQDVDRITDDDIARSKEVPLEELFEIEMKRVSGKLWCKCPWHAGGQESTPSMCIFKDNRYKCFSCGESGDPADYIQKRDGVDFIQAIRQLINK